MVALNTLYKEKYKDIIVFQLRFYLLLHTYQILFAEGQLYY